MKRTKANHSLQSSCHKAFPIREFVRFLSASEQFLERKKIGHHVSIRAMVTFSRNQGCLANRLCIIVSLFIIDVDFSFDSLSRFSLARLIGAGISFFFVLLQNIHVSMMITETCQDPIKGTFRGKKREQERKTLSFHLSCAIDPQRALIPYESYIQLCHLRNGRSISQSQKSRI